VLPSAVPHRLYYVILCTKGLKEICIKIAAVWGFVLVQTLAKIRNSTKRKALRKGFGDLKYTNVSEVTVCHVFCAFSGNSH
jgi:hypothetical protein